MKRRVPKVASVPTAAEGLFIVRTPSDVEPLVTMIMLDQIAGARGDLGIQMPKVDRVKVFACGSQAVVSRTKQTVLQSIGHTDRLEFVGLPEGIGTQPIALELLPAWLPNLEGVKTAGWWVVRHALSGAPTLNLFKALERMRAKLQKAKSRGLVILSTDDATDCSGLESMADEYLTAEACEDGLRGRCISLESAAAGPFTPFVSAKVMCSVLGTATGLRFKFEPFISSELDVRVMARLRGAGRTYEAVGKIVSMDKSTVLRRLRGVRIPSVAENSAWLEAVKDHYGS